MFARVLVATCTVPLLLSAADPTKPIVRYVPMGESSRSIYVPLRGDRHLAYDTELLRVHTAWYGDGLKVVGTPHTGSKTPYICTVQGTAYLSTPPLAPWSIGEQPNVFRSERKQHRFQGMQQTSGRTTFSFQLEDPSGSDVRVRQSVIRLEHVNLGYGMVVEIAPSEESIWHVLQYAPVDAEVREVDGKLVATHEDFSGRFWHAVSTDAEVKLSSRTVAGSYAVRKYIPNNGDIEIAVEEVSQSYHVVLLEIPPHKDPVSVRVISAFQSGASNVGHYERTIDTAKGELRGVDVHIVNESDSEFHTAKQMKARPPRGDDFYQVESFPLPPDVELKVTGMDWLPSGNLAVCTWPGEIWIVENHSGEVRDVRYRLFAEGLNEPLGLAIVDGEMVVGQKPELTRVRDTNNDGVADTFETISDDWDYTGNYHAFAFGPAVDDDGNFYVAFCGQRARQDVKYASWMIKVSPDSDATEGFASGLRAPNGFGFYGPDDDLFIADNQGNWVGASKLAHVKHGKTYGFPAATPAPPEMWAKPPEDFQQPAVWFPRKFSPSTSGFATIPDDAFGPFGGQLMVADFQISTVLRVHLEKVNGEWQGTMFPFTKGFMSGANRLSFDPNGRLYVGGLKNRAWAAVGPFEQSLERVSWTEETPFSVKAVFATKNGFELEFTKPQSEERASNPESYFVSQFNYKHHQTYGSPEFDHDGRPSSATVIRVDSAKLSENGMKVRLTLKGLKAGFVTRFVLSDLESAGGDTLWHNEFFYTLNQIPRE